MTKRPKSASHRAALARSMRNYWSKRRRIEGPTRHRAKRTVSECRDRNEQRTCEHRGCYRNRYRLRSHCKEHAFNLIAHGHPVAKSVRHLTFKPYFLDALAFTVDQHAAGHAGVVAAVRWVEQEIEDARCPEWQYEREPKINRRIAYGHYSTNLLYAHARGTSALEFVARWIAGELADNRQAGEPGPHYASDTHARHQRAKMFLQARPHGVAWKTVSRQRFSVVAPPSTGKLNGKTRALKRPASWSTREFTFERLNAALDLLAIKATQEIRRRQQAGTLATPARASGFTAIVKRRRGEAGKVPLTPLQRQQRNDAIAAMVANGATPEQAGKAFGVHRTTVGQVLIKGYPDVSRRPRYAGRPPKRQSA